jgi:hypothetical protein
VAQGKYLSLEEARKLGKLGRFCKEHPSQGDRRAFLELLDRMAKGDPPKSSPRAGETSGRD